MILQTSFMAPPVGFTIFFLQGVVPKDVILLDIYKGMVPFVALQLLGVAAVVMGPELVTWLPSIAYR